MLVIGSRISSTHFSYDPKTKSFVAEASDLKARGISVYDCLLTVFDDAADRGFVMVSEKSGDELVFVYVGSDTDGEDIHGWRFRAHSKKSTLSELNVLIIND